MKIYTVWYNHDTVEGRGPMLMHNYVFTTKNKAWEFCDLHKGTMGVSPPKGTWKGSNSSEWEVREFVVYSDIPDQNEILKQKALNELTKEEKIALGIV